MRHLKLFIACSLDGFIARPNGDVDWLFTDADYGYTEFMSGIDTTIMGNATYRTALKFEDIPFRDKRNIIFTRQPDRESTRFAEYVSGDIIDYTRRLKEEPGAGIWLVGGADIIRQLYRARLIDDYIIAFHPIILGEGIPLFSGPGIQENLRLEELRRYDSGLVQMVHSRRPDEPAG
ncbi:MAG: dihydrofolate reductase [Chlorobi bacterium]|nr:dihydrofolate reductase [Chlorobiota bacterium]